MKTKIKDLTLKQVGKLCLTYWKHPCPDNCQFKLDDKGNFRSSCKLNNPDYKEEIIEVDGLYELDLSLYDIIILEDSNGIIYREFIYNIEKRSLQTYIETNEFAIILYEDDVNILQIGKGIQPDTIIKEVWHRVDNETFKRIY